MQFIHNKFELLKKQFGDRQISFSDFQNIIQILSEVDQRYIFKEDVVNELFTFLLKKQSNQVDLAGIEALLIQLNLHQQSASTNLFQTISRLLKDQSENNLLNIKHFFLQLSFNDEPGYIENECLIYEAKKFISEKKMEEKSLLELCQYLVLQVNQMSQQYCQLIIMELENYIYQQYYSLYQNNFHDEILVNIHDSNRTIDLKNNVMLCQLNFQANYSQIQDNKLTQSPKSTHSLSEIAYLAEIQQIQNLLIQNASSSQQLIQFIYKILQLVERNEQPNSNFKYTLTKLIEKILEQIEQKFEEKDSLIDQMKNEKLLNDNQLELQNKYLLYQLSQTVQNNIDQEHKIQQLSIQNDSQLDQIDKQNREISRLSEKLLLVANLETDMELLSRKSIYFEKQCSQLEQANYQLNQQNSLLSDQVLSSQQLQDEIISSDNQSNEDKSRENSSMLLSPIMLAVSKRRQNKLQNQIQQLEKLIDEQKKVIQEQKQTLKEQEEEIIFWKNKYEEENNQRCKYCNNNKQFAYSNLPSIAKYQQSISLISSQMDLYDGKNLNIDQFSSMQQNIINPLLTAQENQIVQQISNNIRKRNLSINSNNNNLQKFNCNAHKKVASLVELEIEENETDLQTIKQQEQKNMFKLQLIDCQSYFDQTENPKQFSEQDIVDICQKMQRQQPLRCKQSNINENEIKQTVLNLSQSYDYLNIKNNWRILKLILKQQYLSQDDPLKEQCQSSDLNDLIVYSDSIYEINCQNQKIMRLLIITYSFIFILNVNPNLTIAKQFKLEQVSVLALSTKNANQVALHFRQDQKDLLIETFRRIEMNLIIIKLFKIKKVTPTYQIVFTEHLQIIEKQHKNPIRTQEELITCEEHQQIKRQTIFADQC